MERPLFDRAVLAAIGLGRDSVLVAGAAKIAASVVLEESLGALRRAKRVFFGMEP